MEDLDNEKLKSVLDGHESDSSSSSKPSFTLRQDSADVDSLGTGSDIPLVTLNVKDVITAISSTDVNPEQLDKADTYEVGSDFIDIVQQMLPYIGNFSRGFYFRWVRDLPEIAKNRHSKKINPTLHLHWESLK